MGKLTLILKEFFGARRKDPEFIEYRVKCKKCCEIVSVKVFPDRDLNPSYDDEGPAYTLRKEIMDSKCFRIMTLSVSFDASKKEIEKDISGGEFVP